MSPSEYVLWNQSRRVAWPMTRAVPLRFALLLMYPTIGPLQGIFTHISHINPAGLAAISNIATQCSRIAEHSGYHEC